jgi:hypothetical protein
MAIRFDYLSIEKFAPHLIKKAAVVESGLATYHQVPNILTSNSYVLPVVKPNLMYYTAANQQAAFSANSSVDFEELLIGVDRLEVNLEVNKNVVRDAIYSRLLGDVEDRGIEDLSEHEFGTEVLAYFGQLVKQQFLSDLDKFLLYGKNGAGRNIYSLTAPTGFKMDGILANAQAYAVSDVVDLFHGVGGVTISTTNFNNGYGAYRYVVTITVPLATADLSFLKGKGRLTILGFTGYTGGKPFTVSLTAPYTVSGSNQTFSFEVYNNTGIPLNGFTIVKNTGVGAIMEAAASFAAELQEHGASGVRLYMNNAFLLQYNAVAHANVAIPVDTVSSYQGFEIRTIPSLPDGVLVAGEGTCHVVSGVSAANLQGEDLQVYDLSIIGDKIYRARMSVMIGAASQGDYTALFV